MEGGPIERTGEQKESKGVIEGNYGHFPVVLHIFEKLVLRGKPKDDVSRHVHSREGKRDEKRSR